MEIEAAALQRIFEESKGYPYFLQEWGKHVWNAAATPISVEDVDRATGEVTAALDRNFFRVRFDRLTPIERWYLAAMAALGPGPHRSGDIATQLSRSVSSIAPSAPNSSTRA